MKTVLLMTICALLLFCIPVANAEGIKLTHDDLFRVKRVNFTEDHNNVVFPANVVATISSKDGKSFGFITTSEVLFDLQAGEYMFAGKELVLTE